MARQLKVGDLCPEYGVRTVDGRDLSIPRHFFDEFKNCDFKADVDLDACRAD
jgi:hypothetical protein